MRNRVWVLVALACAVYFVWHAWTSFPRQLGVDLWQPWGIERVHEGLAQAGNPYADAPRYGDFLYAHAHDATSTKLATNAAFWARRSALCFEPTGTPLFYAALAFLPRGFDAAHAFWAWVLYAMAGVGAYGAARLRGFARPPAIAIAMAVLAFFNPVYHDVTVGNVNALQLAAWVGILALLMRRGAAPLWSARLVPALLVLVVLFKPNVLPIAAALMAHYFVVEPRRHWSRDLGFALLGAVAGVAFGALDLGAGAWTDWGRYVNGMHGGTLLYSVVAGNQAPARMLAERFPALGVAMWCVLLLALLAIGFVMARLTSAAPGERALRPLEVLRDPALAMAIGVIVLLVAAPLVWYHYEVLALLPMLACARPRRPLDVGTVLVLVAAVLYSTPLLDALGALDAPGLADAAVQFAWVPLLAAVYLRIAEPGRRPVAAPVVANVAPEAL